MGTQGFSPRTRSDAQLVRRGAPLSRIALTGDRDESPRPSKWPLRPRRASERVSNGAPLRSTEALRAEIATLVFTPGPPCRRQGRAGGAEGVFRPLTRAALSGSRRPVRRVRRCRRSAERSTPPCVAAGLSARDAVEPWTERVCSLGASLVAARSELRGAALAALRRARRRARPRGRAPVLRRGAAHDGGICSAAGARSPARRDGDRATPG